MFFIRVKMMNFTRALALLSIFAISCQLETVYAKGKASANTACLKKLQHTKKFHPSNKEDQQKAHLDYMFKVEPSSSPNTDPKLFTSGNSDHLIGVDYIKRR